MTTTATSGLLAVALCAALHGGTAQCNGAQMHARLLQALSHACQLSGAAARLPPCLPAPQHARRGEAGAARGWTRG